MKIKNLLDKEEKRRIEKNLENQRYEDIRDKNISFYDLTAQNYFDLSYTFDMNKIQDRFLQLGIPKGGELLDAGCGSGRDSWDFINKGYNVLSIDGSQKLVDLVNQNPTLNCIKKDFLEIDYKNKFDGVWCCAALLHVPPFQFKKAFTNLTNSLKENGLLYFSIKQLENNYLDDGKREFFHPGKENLYDIFNKLNLELVDYYETGKQNEPNQLFENYIVKKLNNK